MTRLSLIELVVFAIAAIPVLAALTGCGPARESKSQKLLLDAAHPPQDMYHVTVVEDPLGGAGKVLAGGPPGPGNKTDANKASLIAPKGFFVMPAAGDAQLHLVVGVRELRELRVQVTAKPKGSKRFQVQLAAAGAWQEVVLPLDRKDFVAGSLVYDITVFQAGKSDKAELYVKSVSVRMQ